jgi:cytochrome c oxidase cbb3-type subunit 3
MSSFVSALITFPTLLNIGAALWLLWWTSRRRGEDKAAETTGHVWDGDLTEYNKPLPRWWLVLFVLTVVFGVAYLLLYPGLGNFTGVRKWTQIEQYEQQSREAEAVLARTFAPFEKKSVQELEVDPVAVRYGRNLFLNNCAGCHGSDGGGAPGFPNLTDKDWLWGGAPDTVLASIQNGRTAVMPPWGTILGRQGVENVLAYVMSLSGRKVLNADAEAGAKTFAQTCIACHGPDAHGNPMLGAPNLADNTWLYGGSIDAVRQTIANGRQGQMPAHLERLGEVRTRLVAAYVLSAGAQAQTATAQTATISTATTQAATVQAAAGQSP